MIVAMNKRTIETEIIETGEQRGGRGRRITPAARRAVGNRGQTRMALR